MTNLDLDAILSDDDWLRRIARRLVRDPDVADDLVQDVWVTSLERGSVESPSRPWLVGVLRNTGRHFFRSGTRERARRARIAEGQSQEAPSTDDLVAELQLRERAARELLALDEPYRRALYLVYVSDLSISEAARRVGVANSTMSERVQRGLRRLRKRMDAAYDGDRRAWAMTLLPMAAPENVALLGSGVGLMVAGVAALVVIGVVGALALGDAPPPVQDAAQAHVAGPPEVRGSVETELARVNATSTAREAPAARGAEGSLPTTTRRASNAVIRGRFLRADGAPAAGATWRLSGSGSNPSRITAFSEPEDWEGMTGVIDGEGYLEVAFNPPQAYRMGLSVQDGVHLNAGWDWKNIGSTDVIDLGTTTLRAGGAVVGRVVDENGAPVLGYRWTVYADDFELASIGGRMDRTRSTTIDEATGRFRIERLPAGRATVSLSSRRAVKEPTLTVNIVEGEEVVVELVATEVDAIAHTITVRLRADAYEVLQAIKLSSVRLMSLGGQMRSPVQPYERIPVFLFKDLPDGSYSVLVDDPDHGPWRRDGVSPGDSVTAKLVGNVSLALSVTTPNGAPVALYSVEIEMIERRSGGQHRLMHDGQTPLEGGRIAGLVAASYRLHVRADSGRAAVEVSGLATGESRHVRIELELPAVVTGRVVRPDGSPVAGAMVQLVRPAKVDDSIGTFILTSMTSTSHPERARQEVAVAGTDENGRFRLETAASGVHLLVARERGAKLVQSDLIDVVIGESVDGGVLTLPRTCSVAGRILVPDFIDLDGWSVDVVVAEGGRYSGLSDERSAIQVDGGFHIGQVPSGAARLYLFQPNPPAAWGPGPPTGTFLVASFDLAAGEHLERVFPLPEPLPLALTFDVLVPGDLPALKKVWLTGQAFTGRRPTGHGPGPRVGPIIAEALRYGIAAVGDGWLYWQKAGITPSLGHATLPLVIEIEHRRVRVLHAGNARPGASLEVLLFDGKSWWTEITYEPDREGWVDIRLSQETFRFCLRVPGEFGVSRSLAWPPPAGVTEIDFD